MARALCTGSGGKQSARRRNSDARRGTVGGGAVGDAGVPPLPAAIPLGLTAEGGQSRRGGCHRHPAHEGELDGGELGDVQEF
jgi:hypothetical protein